MPTWNVASAGFDIGSREPSTSPRTGREFAKGSAVLPEHPARIAAVLAGNADGGCPEKGGPIPVCLIGSDETERQPLCEFGGLDARLTKRFP